MIVCDYQCQSCHKVSEAFVNKGTTEVLCSNCGGIAQLVPSVSNFHLPGWDPSFSTQWDKWENDKRKRIKAEIKQNS